MASDGTLSTTMIPSTTNVCSNTTPDNASNDYSPAEVTMMGISMLTISLSAIIGNSIVVWILPQVTSISSTTKTVLLSLAVTDIGSGLTWLLSAAEAFAQTYDTTFILKNHPNICFMQGLLFLIFVDVSLMSQAIIAIDRLLILTRKKKWTSKVVRMRGIVIGSWIIGSAWCIAKATIDKHEDNYYSYDNNTFLCQKLHDSKFRAYQIAGMVMFVATPLLIVIAAYGRIAFLMKKIMKRRNRRGIDRGVIHMMVALVAVFYIMNVGFRQKAKENLKWLFETVCPCCSSLPEDDGLSDRSSIGSSISTIVRRQTRRFVGFREREPEIIPRENEDPFCLPRRNQTFLNDGDIRRDIQIDQQSIECSSIVNVARSTHEYPNPQTQRAEMCRENEGSVLRSMCVCGMNVTYTNSRNRVELGHNNTIYQDGELVTDV